MAVLGNDGRAELLRQSLKALDIDPDKVIKEQKQLEAMADQQITPNAAAGVPTPMGMTPGAPPPAPAGLDAAGSPVAGRDNQLFESPGGVTP